MPVQFYNLGFNVYHAENAQALQNFYYAQLSAGGEVTATKAREQAKMEQNLQIQNTNDIQNKEISGEEKGSHSYFLQERTSKEEENATPQLPDPLGKGQILDIEA
jgi:hypothetical protein